MRNSLKVLLVVALAIPTMASALISNTKHNLTNSGPGSVKFTDVSADQCRFCHLVHDANTTAGTLWARQTPTGTGFTSPNATADGTLLDAGNGALGAASQKCLSCHDGTIALNVVINSLNVTSTVATTIAAGANTVAGGGGQVLRGFTYMQNLNGQHPVGIPFAGQTNSLAVANEYGTALVTPGCQPGVPVCVQGATTPTAGAYLRLYGAAGAYQVECGSCHEPHTENVGGNFPFFLRVPGTITNGRCGGCHRK